MDTKELRQSFLYTPVELSFGTSGLRGLVRDITSLEAFIGTRGFLEHMQATGAAARGGAVYVAGDLRPSTDSILQAVLFSIRDAGMVPAYLGKIPSPALMLHAVRRRAPSVMVTGSHIPFDRNGIKFNTPVGEVLKTDEAPILEAMRRIRAREYGRPAAESPFDAAGMLKENMREPLPAPLALAREEYVQRFAAAFPPGVLSGKRILAWQHSAVGRDILVEVLSALGAEVMPVGRSDTFVAIDTEAVSAETIALIQALVDENGGERVDAVVSTDGDSDRPLLLGVDGGRVRFFPGDLLGLVTAGFLGARHAAVPISVNDAIDAEAPRIGLTVVKTRIGSPHVIAAMREVGWEANGGFLTAAPLTVPGGKVIDPLPTRDAVLPILSVLSATLGRGEPVSAVFDRLPPRFGKAALLREFPRETALRITARLSPKAGGIVEAVFEGEGITVTHPDGGTEALRIGSPLHKELLSIRETAGAYFTAADGFSKIARINWLDGVRLIFDGGEVAHVRPSGNAPELRLYALASHAARAEEIAAMAAADGGILRRMQRDAEGAMTEGAGGTGAGAEAEAAIKAFRADPCPLLLTPRVQHYDWGGRRVIPELLGKKNSEDKPFAELWIGAHPKAPSGARACAEGGEAGSGPEVPLDRLISGAGDVILGKTAMRVFDGTLPYLFKALDAASMLSIQAHPTKAQAEAGFERENAAGIPLSAANRSYPDRNHKPEVHAALTDFWMLHGFRTLEEIARAMKDAPELSALMPDFTRRLAQAGADGRARELLLRALYQSAMRMPQEKVDAMLTPLLERLSKSPTADKESPDYWALAASRIHGRGGHHDRGIVSFYLLNLLHLRPGQGTFQPAGILHAYLEGATVELMANSDNVLRGGLTTKYVDVEELLKTLTFKSGPPSVLEGQRISSARVDYPTPAAEFLLSRLSVGGEVMERVRGPHGADCLLVTEGTARVASAGRVVTLGRGGAALIPAALPYEVGAASGTAVVFRAGIPARKGG